MNFFERWLNNRPKAPSTPELGESPLVGPRYASDKRLDIRLTQLAGGEPLYYAFLPESDTGVIDPAQAAHAKSTLNEYIEELGEDMPDCKGLTRAQALLALREALDSKRVNQRRAA